MLEKEETTSLHESSSKGGKEDSGRSREKQWNKWKSSERSCSSEGEDAEPELEAIPESPKSESFEDLCVVKPVEARVVSEPCLEGMVTVTETWAAVVEEK